MSPGGRLRLPGHLAFALSLIAALTAATPAAAQSYRSPLSAFANGGSQLSHAAPDARWDGIRFPARRSRRYKRAPIREALAARRQACEPHFVEAAKLYNLPVHFLRAVAHVESGFATNALSVDGALGIMQLMPFTARKMGVTRPEDARENILGGARFLRILANQWSGNIVLTVASYNAGAGAVKRYGGVPPFRETQRYVQRVLARFEAYTRETQASVQPPPQPSAPQSPRSALHTIIRPRLTPPTEAAFPTAAIQRDTASEEDSCPPST